MRTVRKSLGLTLDQVAKDLNIPKTTLYRIEMGDAPTVRKQHVRALFSYFKEEVPLLAIYDPHMANQQ